MKKILVAGVLAMLGALMLAPAALAQSPSEGDLYDCQDFATQEEAQAVYNQDTSDPYGLDGPIGEAFTGEPGVACEGLPSGGTGGTNMPQQPTAPSESEFTDLDCVDFATQAEAQAVYNQNTSDPHGLDADFDGVACEEGDEVVPVDTPDVAVVTPDQAVVTPDKGVQALPETGGTSLLLPAAGVLLITGLIGLRLVRRS